MLWTKFITCSAMAMLHLLTIVLACMTYFALSPLATGVFIQWGLLYMVVHIAFSVGADVINCLEGARRAAGFGK